MALNQQWLLLFLNKACQKCIFLDHDLGPFCFSSGNLPGQVFCTIVSATGISSSKFGAVKMLSAELATSSSCARSTFGPIPRE